MVLEIEREREEEEEEEEEEEGNGTQLQSTGIVNLLLGRLLEGCRRNSWLGEGSQKFVQHVCASILLGAEV
jgi:hypothetical protein